jgi:copper chaperone
MIRLTIPNISCGHCERAVTNAITALDAGAKVDINIAAKSVVIDTQATPEAVNASLAEAGYPASPA